MRGRSLSPAKHQGAIVFGITITADSTSGCAATYKVNICNQGVNKSTLVCFSWTRVKWYQHPLCHKETCGTSWGRIVHTPSEPGPRSVASPRITNGNRESAIAEAAGCHTWDWEQTYSSWWQPGPGLIPAPWCLRERKKRKTGESKRKRGAGWDSLPRRPWQTDAFMCVERHRLAAEHTEFGTITADEPRSFDADVKRRVPLWSFEERELLFLV